MFYIPRKIIPRFSLLCFLAFSCFMMLTKVVSTVKTSWRDRVGCSADFLDLGATYQIWD